MSNPLNSVLIEGNMVRSPLFRTTQKGTKVCNFTIASTRYYRNDDGMEKEVCFFDVEAWAKLADICYDKGRKGRSVRVVGRLKQDRWTGSDGKPHFTVSIVAEHIEYRGQVDNPPNEELEEEATKEVDETSAMLDYEEIEE